MTSPLRIAVINDFPLIVHGVEHLLAKFPDRVEVHQWSAGPSGSSDVDIALFDAFAAVEVTRRIQQIARTGTLVVVYSWMSAPAAIERAMAGGASGFVSKKMDAPSLIGALEQVHAGQVVKMLSAPAVADPDAEVELWPGQAVGLNERESEVLALVTRGLRNKEIAKIMFVGPDSVKAYIRRAYRKIGVDSRTKAVLWAMDNGFRGQDRHVNTPATSLSGPRDRMNPRWLAITWARSGRSIDARIVDLGPGGPASCAVGAALAGQPHGGTHPSIQVIALRPGRGAQLAATGAVRRTSTEPCEWSRPGCAASGHVPP